MTWEERAPELVLHVVPDPPADPFLRFRDESIRTFGRWDIRSPLFAKRTPSEDDRLPHALRAVHQFAQLTLEASQKLLVPLILNLDLRETLDLAGQMLNHVER